MHTAFFRQHGSNVNRCGTVPHRARSVALRATSRFKSQPASRHGCKTLVAADHGLYWVIRLVAVLNLAFFGIEFMVTRIIGSVSMFADSIDLLEDASVNFLILSALGWTARARPCRHGVGGHPACAAPLGAVDGMAKI
jgi:hypothetical protein